MADIQYLNYGDQQIEQQALLNNLANQVQGYVQKQPWSNKRKEMFMSAYSELMNRGIQGASNTNGQWMLNVGGDTPLDLDSKSKKEKEMYQEAAYFIQQQMAGLPTKTSQEEKKKEDLPVFDNKYFTSELIKHISNKDYGGQDILMGDGEKENDWNRLDARNEKGIRGRKNRANTLAKYLKEYSDSLEESKYNFEGSPFKDLTDFKTRISAAVQALNTSDESDDIPALNAIGLRASDWFNNGSGDPYKTEGYEGTYGDYYGRFLPLQEKDKAKVKAEKQKAVRANQFDNYRFFNFLNGTPGSQEDFNLIGQKLSGQQTLDGNDISRISWAFRQGMKNGGLTNLSKEELSKFGSRYISTPNRLKKLPGLEGIYYDSYANRLIQPFKGQQQTGTNLSGILEQNNPENKQAQIKSQLVKQMNQPIQGSLNLSDLSNFGFDEATGNELWAVINDIGAFIDPEAISGTALALNAARLRDKNREGWSWERVLDWGTSALGGLPVIGDAASVVKAGSNLVKLANRSARVGSFIGMAFSAANMPEAWDSIKKIYNKGITNMTPQDIQNITYGLMGLFAGIKTINAVNARQKPQTATEYSIEIDGKKVKLPDQATAYKVSAEYKSAKNNTEASQKAVKMQEVREAAKKAGIEITDASKVTSGSGFLRGNQVSRKLGISKSPVKSEQVNTGEMTGGSTGGYYMPSWRRSFLNQEQKEIKNPLRKTFDWFLGRTPEVKSTKTPRTTEIKSSIETPYKPLVENSPLKSQPKGESSELFNIRRPIKEPKSTPNYGKKDLNEVQKSIENIRKFRESYGFDGTKKPMAKGFDGETIKEGSLSFEFGGEKITLKVSKSDLKGVDRKHANFNSYVVNIRNRIAKQIEEFSKKHSVEETSKLIEGSLKKGWLKQGGRIDKQKIQKYKEFINK